MRRTSVEPYTRDGLLQARAKERCLSTMCRHVANDDYYARPFLLEPFQRENMWLPVFGSGEVVDGQWRRRYRRAIFCLPSGYGKTEMAAAIVLTIATTEVVYNGEYGVVASSLDQVGKIYNKIVTMIKLDPVLSKQWDTGKKVITHLETGAKIMVFPNKADALEGWHLNVVVFDEMHVYKDSRVWDAALKGQKVLTNPLAIGITTAGDAREGFLWDTLEKGMEDPGMYIYWLGLDDDADLDKREDWEPLMVASWVTWESIEDQRGSATSRRSFERYTANRFPKDRDDYSCFTHGELAACARRENRWDWERPFALGIDGATSGDSFAIVGYQRFTDEEGEHHNVREWVFDEPDEETGRYPLNDIMELVAFIYQEYFPAVVGIDPNRMIVMSSQLKDMYGVDTVSFPQNNAVMCQASQLVIHLVKSGALSLQGCPKTLDHLANTVEDDKGGYGARFGKNSRKDKIDAAIALAIAVLGYDKLVGDGDMYATFND